MIVLHPLRLIKYKYELKGDCFSGEQFDSLITIDTSIFFQKTCVLCNTTSLHENISTYKIEIFPNPFKDKIFIQCNKSDNGNAIIDLYSMDGSKIFSQTFSNVKANETLKLYLKENLPAGIYLLKVTVAGQQRVRKLIRE